MYRNCTWNCLEKQESVHDLYNYGLFKKNHVHELYKNEVLKKTRVHELYMLSGVQHEPPVDAIWQRKNKFWYHMIPQKGAKRMEKSVRQLAEELGVSKQAVLYRLHRLEDQKNTRTNRQKLSTNKNGKIYITVLGESLIKSDYYKKATNKQKDKKQTNKPIEDAIEKNAKKLEMLQQQVDHMSIKIGMQEACISELQKIVYDLEKRMEPPMQRVEAEKKHSFLRKNK